MRKILAAAALGIFASAAFAGPDDINKVKSEADVEGTMDALQAAVESAGATVFARVDHAKGAEEAGMYMNPSQVLVFGNPKLGTPAMQADAMAGLFLPMKVLVYLDKEGQVWLAYEDPADMFEDVEGVSEDAEFVGKMREALKSLTQAAAEG